MTQPNGAAGPSPLQWLFILLGLGALAVTQPLFADLSEAPELFVFYGTTTGDLWILALLAVFAVPVTLWLVGWLVGLANRRLGALVHRGGAALLAAVLAVQVARVLGIERPIVLAGAGLAGGVLAWFALVRLRFIREWAMVLAPAGLVFAGLFLFTSAPARAVDGAAESSDPIEPSSVDDQVAPLAILVLDELPTRSVVTDDMELDPSVVPNLAAFAEDATWYRGHTTVAEQTTQALPALLSGRYTESANQDALWFDHPDNLYRLLASTHELQVSEAITQLCPPTICGRVENAEEVSVERAEAAWRRLLRDARDVVRQRAWPWSDPQPIGLDRFADTDGDFPVFAEQGAVDVLDPIAKFFGLVSAAQPGRFTEFLDAMAPPDGDRPPAHVFHLVLPHQPWVFRPDGAQRVEPDPSYLGWEGGRVLDEPYAVSVGRTHHLDQTTYADALVGSFLGRLDEIGVYDDAMIVIVSDHGVSFVQDTAQRAVDDRNAAEILPTPLFVKLPRQSEGAIVDDPVQTVDLAALIAEHVGVGIPWETDGVPPGDRDGETRYLDEDGGMKTLDHGSLMADLQGGAAFDQSPDRVLSRAGLTVEQAVPVPDAERTPVEGPLDDYVLGTAPEGAAALGLFVGEELVAVGMAAASGKVAVIVPEDLWGTAPADAYLAPVEPGSND